MTNEEFCKQHDDIMARIQLLAKSMIRFNETMNMRSLNLLSDSLREHAQDESNVIVRELIISTLEVILETSK